MGWGSFWGSLALGGKHRLALGLGSVLAGHPRLRGQGTLRHVALGRQAHRVLRVRLSVGTHARGKVVRRSHARRREVAGGSHAWREVAGRSVEALRRPVQAGSGDVSQSTSSDLLGLEALSGHVVGGRYLRRLSVGSSHAEVHVGPGGVVAPGHPSSVIVEVGPPHRLVSLGSLNLLLALHLGVLDVDAVLVDVSLLVVGSQLSVPVTLDEDVVVVGSHGDVVVKLLDVLVVELVEEVDDQPAGDLVDLDPRRVDRVLVGLCHSLCLITVDLEELLGLDDVEAEVVVLPDCVLSRSLPLDRLGCQLVEEAPDVLLSDFLSDHRDDHRPGVLDVPETAVENSISELGPQSLEVLVGLDGLLVGGEGDVGPSSSLLVNGGVSIDDVPLRSLLLHELLDLISKRGGILVRVSLDSLEVKHVRLVLLGILVDLTLGIPSKDIIVVDPVTDAVENDLVLILASSIVGNCVLVASLDGQLSNLLGLLDVTDVEEHTGVSQQLLV